MRGLSETREIMRMKTAQKPRVGITIGIDLGGTHGAITHAQPIFTCSIVGIGRNDR
jgi:hypothetical protein